MIDKCERLLVSGLVPVCWLIWPEHNAAFSFDLKRGLSQESGQLVSAYGSRHVVLSLSDVLGNLPTES